MYSIRSIDKRQSATLSDISPPLQSFYDSESPDELALVEAAREYGIRLLRRRFNEVVVFIRAKQQSVKFEVAYTSFSVNNKCRFFTHCPSTRIERECP